jgi:hypothetical protein
MDPLVSPMAQMTGLGLRIAGMMMPGKAEARREGLWYECNTIPEALAIARCTVADSS